VPLPGGFESDDGLLPYPARSFVGYRLLTELFTFPQKFHFVDVDIPPEAASRAGNALELYVYLNRSAPDLEANLSADTFRLGCTPVVNLYAQRAEPVRLTHTDPEYRVVPDVRRPLAHEVYSVDRATATSPDGREREFQPFFSVRHAGAGTDGAAYWHATRRPAAAADTPRRPDAAVDPGTEVYLSVVDLGFAPAAPADWTLHVETTCLNRDLPGRLPFGGGQPRLQLADGGGAVTRVRCLTPPTPTRRGNLRREGLWRLTSHLNLNHLSVTGGEEGGAALREILTLYDFANSAETQAMIAGVLAVDGKRVLARSAGALCRGVELTVRFDETRFAGPGLYLFAAVLERFFALYASVNSFTRAVATVAGREGVYKRWPARIGERVLV
jgi:type VI secretion system protein ImpG